MKKNPISITHTHLAAEWDYEANREVDIDFVTYGSHKRVGWVCSFGHKWIGAVKSRALKNMECVYCTHKKLLPGFNDFATLFPVVAEEWSEKNLRPASSYWASSKEIVSWTCSLCGSEWDQAVGSRKTPYCFACSHMQAGEKRRKSAAARGESVATDIVLSSLWATLNPIDPSEVSVNSSLEALWALPCSHEVKTRIKDRKKSPYSCSLCDFSYFEEMVVEKVREEYDGTLLRNRRPLVTDDGAKRELDIWLPDLHLAFEVQDFLTHSLTSDTETSHVRGNRIVKKGPRYHEEKRGLAEDQLGVKIVEIWQDSILDGSFKSLVQDSVRRAQDSRV